MVKKITIHYLGRYLIKTVKTVLKGCADIKSQDCKRLLKTIKDHKRFYMTVKKNKMLQIRKIVLPYFEGEGTKLDVNDEASLLEK